MKINEIYNIVILIFAFFFSAISFGLILHIYFNYKKEKNQKFKLRKAAGAQTNLYAEKFCCDGFANKILVFMIKNSYKIKFVSGSSRIIQQFVKNKELPKQVKALTIMSNIPDDFNNFQYREIQLKLCIVFCSVALVFGAMFSTILMFILFFLGLFLALFAQR